MSEANGATPDVIQPSPTPVTFQAAEVSPYVVQLAFMTCTGMFTVFMDKPSCKRIAQELFKASGGIVIPNMGE